jgi:hypothetical protein
VEPFTIKRLADPLDQLEQKIREKIDEPYRERVSIQAECDLFVGYEIMCTGSLSKSDGSACSVISTAIMVQLREVDLACEAALSTMSRTVWSNLKQVSGQSAYAGDVVSSVEQVIALVKPLVEQKKYLRNLFDKTCRYAHACLLFHRDASMFRLFGSLIITKFTNALVKSRPLKEIGAEQVGMASSSPSNADFFSCSHSC